MPNARHLQVKAVPRRSAGFSMVEILVGMIIGLLGIIVMMNLFSVFEGQKRSTSGTSDVLNNGAITLFGLQSDIRQAGFDINSKNLLGCSLTVPVPPAPNLPNPPVQFILNALAPVTINPASPIFPGAIDANTDTLLVVSGNSNGQPEGEVISSLGASAVVATTFNVKFQPPSAKIYDQVIFEPVARPAVCNLSVDSVTVGFPTSSTTITLNSGLLAAAVPPVVPSIGTMFNLGNTVNGNVLKVIAYAVRGGKLTLCDYMQSDCSNINNWSTLADDIVSLKAQYGRDDTTINPAPMTGIVNVYDQTTPASASATYACDWMRVSSVHIALVGRNGQPDKNIITSSAPTWTANPLNGTPVSIDLTGTTTPPALTWQNYRYKVFETTVPIRNMAINGAVAGC